MKSWGHSVYLVVTDGPAHYRSHYNTDLWDVNTIERGIFIEEAQEGRRFSFWAIDLDRNRLYYHYESGGFSAPISSRSQDESTNEDD